LLIDKDYEHHTLQYKTHTDDNTNRIQRERERESYLDSRFYRLAGEEAGLLLLRLFLSLPTAAGELCCGGDEEREREDEAEDCK
jgi:hypothetical protein